MLTNPSPRQLRVHPLWYPICVIAEFVMHGLKALIGGIIWMADAMKGKVE